VDVEVGERRRASSAAHRVEGAERDHLKRTSHKRSSTDHGQARIIRIETEDRRCALDPNARILTFGRR
jgi:hypothetical protein